MYFVVPVHVNMCKLWRKAKPPSLYCCFLCTSDDSVILSLSTLGGLIVEMYINCRSVDLLICQLAGMSTIFWINAALYMNCHEGLSFCRPAGVSTCNCS